jgi:hypothetical protein
MIDKESDAFEQRQRQRQQAHCSHVRADQAVVARSGPAMLRTFQYTVSSNGNGQQPAQSRALSWSGTRGN